MIARSATRSAAGDPGLGAKVAFLARAESYPDGARRVDLVETHMSWVFLTDRHAYKLKKPVRQSYLDFTTEAARRYYCAEEVRLNRRLTQGVYLGIVPLALDSDGRLRLGADGSTIDWLVKMRRLPADRMLDVEIRAGSASVEDVGNVVGALCKFYRGCEPIPLRAGEYRDRFAAHVAGNLRELTAREFALPSEMIEPACARQRAFLDRAALLFERRARAGHVVEAHGDLRPEHVCLEPHPQIIDCLEFSRDFRVLDTADELAFLALECERLGAAWIRDVIFRRYAELTGDAPGPKLVHFYQSHRACTRAKIAIWHLKEPGRSDGEKWTMQARDYLRLAALHIARCG